MKNHINTIVRVLVISDFFLFFSSGLITPIFAVFLIDEIPGSTLEVVGLATSIFWVSRISSVIPISKLIDKLKGYKDEYYLLIFGTLFIASLPLLYIFVSKSWQVYVIQFFNGIAFSMVVPSWRVIFTKNLDRDKVGFEWSLDDVGIGIATSISAYLGSLIAQEFGFKVLFVCMFLIGLTSFLTLLFMYKGDGALFDVENKPVEHKQL